MAESFKIVVPSRNRVRLMPRILELLPSAIICVARSERTDYAAVVPARRLLCHEDLPGIIAIRNWLSEKVQEDCLIQVDDDLRGVNTQIGKKRLITEGATIEAILDNGRQVSLDLGIDVFCWSRTQNQFLADPEFLPFRFVQPISCMFGIRGAARARRFDPSMPGRADADFTLRTLLEDRVIWSDMRFYFNHGSIYTGKGGQAGILSDKAFEDSTRNLAIRWGPYISFKGLPWRRKRGTRTSPLSIKVSRTNPLAKAALQE